MFNSLKSFKVSQHYNLIKLYANEVCIKYDHSFIIFTFIQILFNLLIYSDFRNNTLFL